MFLNNFLIMTMTTHTANWLATRSATHGQRTTTAVTDSERESQRQRESFNFTENERESEAIKRARERGASLKQRRQLRCEWASKAEFKTRHTQAIRRGG